MTVWAKRRDGVDGTVSPAFLSLIEHSADVAAVASALLARPVIADRLARLLVRPCLTDADRQRILAVIALHDLGKVNHGFQRRIRAVEGPHAGHTAPLADLLWGGGAASDERVGLAAALRDAVGWTDLEGGWTGIPFEHVLRAVLAHHGRPLSAHRFNAPDLWRPSGGEDPMDGVAQLAAAVRAWLPQAFASREPPLRATPRFLHALAGFTTLADWIGSDEAVFPLRREGDDASAGRYVWSRARADEVLQRRFLDPDATRIVLPAALSFAALFPAFSDPRPAQQAMDALPLDRPGQVVVVEAETGSGKTEAALAHFLRLFRAGEVDGLYFALPTRAAAKQVQQRVFSEMRRLFGDAAPPVGLAVPGLIRADDSDGIRLPGFEVQWPDDPSDRLADRGWAAERPKRYLAGAVMVGTVDQLLMGSLAVRHAHLRSFCMLRLLIVVDEVHASDPYMAGLLGAALDQHRASGGQAMLMSATLGSTLRHRLERRWGRSRQQPSLAEAAARPYPSVTADGIEVPMSGVTFRFEKEVWLRLHSSIDDMAPTLANVKAAAAAGARVLVLRNRVADAVETFRALEAAGALLFACAGVAAPHHGRFAQEDRALLDPALEARFGRKGPAGGCIAVATQTAEQSLDLDFDFLVTDLCPVDVLLQRLGRLHRHPERLRPPGHRKPVVVVLAPAEEGLGRLIASTGEVKGRSLLGLGKVYPDLLAAVATRRLIEESPVWRIPAMNRTLVERATHSDALRRLAEVLGGLWQGHWQYIDGIRSAHAALAAMNTIAWEKPMRPVDQDVEAQIRTRLCLDARQAVLPQPVPGPFGRLVSSITIPAWMAPDAGLEACAGDSESLPEGGFRFSYAGRRFRYDRFGLAHDKAPVKGVC